ncbi:MAG: glutathione S-transferase domain-containing protein, partial [Gammaproteobacteria bacterium]|nr:glutathione S-transferase domain-containing protein [Gammaproteobacteria bacterium]
MIGRRLFVHAVFLTLAPVVVAWFGLSVPGALFLVLLLLLWRWIIVLSGFAFPGKTPELVLAAISASHFVEKVRWCMDRLGLDYVEQTSGGTLGAFFRGRTVPQLKMRTGSVQSSIGNSAEILRYLWG